MLHSFIEFLCIHGDMTVNITSTNVIGANHLFKTCEFYSHSWQGTPKNVGDLQGVGLQRYSWNTANVSVNLNTQSINQPI